MGLKAIKSLILPYLKTVERQKGVAVFRRALILLIQAYKVFISPALPPSCRFYPSCSDYARAAIEAHGVFYGVFLAAKRLLRCNPFFEGGYDPAPEAHGGHRHAIKTPHS